MENPLKASVIDKKKEMYSLSLYHSNYFGKAKHFLSFIITIQFMQNTIYLFEIIDQRQPFF